MIQDSVRIFDYNDYRGFLKDFYQWKKSGNPGYSHRVFAQRAGLSSPSHLGMIIKGERNLTSKTIHKFALGLGLKNNEREFFETLVHYNQESDLSQKAMHFTKMLQIKGTLNTLSPLQKEKFDFLAKWYVVALYVLIGTEDFKDDTDWIVKRLKNKVSSYDIKSAFKTLLKLNLIEKSNSGQWEQSVGALSVDDDTKTLAVYNHHKSMIELGYEALKSLDNKDREVNAVTISIPVDKLEVFKTKIREFRKEINQLASEMENSDEVYQLNIQFFPLTERDDL